MFFKNAVMFRFPKAVVSEFQRLEEALEEVRLKPIGPQEYERSGFVPPLGRKTTALHHRAGKAIWLCVGREARVLPPAAVNEVLQARLQEIEEREGVAPGARVRAQMKDDVLQEMLPRAFTVTTHLNVYINMDMAICVVDTASRKAAEAVVSLIRTALGSFPALPLNAEKSPRMVLTGMVAGDSMPDRLVVGEETELKDGSDSGATIKAQRQDLGCEEIRAHLESGKHAVKLAFTHDDHVSFVLGEDLIIRKLKFLDGALETLDGEATSIAEEMDARFVLFDAEMSALAETLFATFAVSEAEPLFERATPASSQDNAQSPKQAPIGQGEDSAHGGAGSRAYSPRAGDAGLSVLPHGGGSKKTQCTSGANQASN